MAARPILKVQLPWDEPYWEQIQSLLQKTYTTPAEADHLIGTLHGLAQGKNIGDANFFEKYYQANSSEQEEFFKRILPFIQQLALEGPSLFPEGVALLVQQVDAGLTFSKKAAASLMCHLFFGSINSTHINGRAFPEFTLEMFYFTANRFEQKMKFLLHYFDRISAQMPEGNLIIHRQSIPKRNLPAWKQSQEKLSSCQVFVDGRIEESKSVFHADFANQYIGGGVLHGGAVQEEILFLIKPECLVSLLMCEVMEENEAIFIHGAEQFSKYQGYGGSLKYGGDHQDQTERNADGDIQTIIFAYDAIMSPATQFGEKMFFRDLNKAFIAFTIHDEKLQDSPIVTGNWGCGAFGGDRQLKFLQQLIAASQAHRPLEYYTFGQKDITEDIDKFMKELAGMNVTVGDLVKAYFRTEPYRMKTFELVLEALKNK